MSTVQLHRPNVPACCDAASSDDPFLHFAGPVSFCHALVIAPNGLDLMCRLLHQGCSAATTLHPAERADCRAYDLVLAPHVGSAMQIGRLIAQAKRALLPAGRFLAFVPDSAGEPEDDVGGLMIRTLRLAGFASVRSKTIATGVLIRAAFAMPEVISEWTGARPGRAGA